ncbi:hypothetical protein BGW38_003067 [Lunasporangiospora selenospora]|uniref:Protein kinase domain-containing protein n=1 Tax=Lunasporangiospora selenospora TaxID=979761 RepID=A0A9P6KCG9_9FUNG|nr:hypothetical protein BGW38_003067 [Lunasporangiospora selenospora]
MRQIDYSAITNIKPLKKGGYGEIHTAEWSRLKVVLKRALPENDEGVEQFDQELEILKRVHDYDFIVRFYGVTVDPSTNTKCMVMKHCINGNLCSFLEKNHETLTWLERYRLSIEIAKGLEFLHKSGFHHRDLHSGNILLDDKLTAMICDFGLSRSSARGKQSDAAATIGVSSFLAPERFPAQRPVYTSACDIYSLGVIFWHISSGRIPFQKRLHEPKLLSDLLEGLREDIVPGTPSEYRDLVVKCWDRKPAKRLKIDVVIAVLQTLMAKPSEPEHQISTGFFMPSETSSASLPVPPDLGARMSSLERAASELNRMVYEIQDPMVHETVRYIERDVAALNFHLSSRRSLHHNPINESSEKTGDTALHLACLFLASPMDTIKVLVELGADINLENRQGYTPVMILVTSNTQHCYDALKFFVMRGARIPAYIRNPITPLNSAQIHALNLVSESRQFELVAATAGGVGVGAVGGAAASSLLRVDRRPMPQQMHHRNGNGASFMEGQSGMMTSAISSRDAGRLLAQGRPLIHVVAAMQDDQKIIDCLCEAVEFAGETALVAAAAHLRINNVKWLLWHDLDISSTEAGIQRAIKIVKMLHPSATSTGSSATPGGGGNDRLNVNNGHGGSSNGKHRKSASTPVSGRIWDHFMGSSSTRDKLENIRDLGKYSWAGMAIGDADDVSKDMARPVLHLLEEWTGSRRIELRKVVATQLKVMYGDSMGPSGSPYQQSLPVMRQQQQYAHPMAGSDASLSSSGSVNSIGRPEEGANMGDLSSYPQNGHHVSRETNGSHGHGNGNLHRQSHQQLGRGRNGGGTMSSRKNQRHLIDQALSEKPTLFWRAI